MDQGIHQTKCPACRDSHIYIKSIVAQGNSFLPASKNIEGWILAAAVFNDIL